MIVNLLSYAVNLNNGTRIPPSGKVAYIPTFLKKSGEKEGCPIVMKEFSYVRGLPSPQEDTLYIVSEEVFNVVGDKRTDLITINKDTAFYHGDRLFFASNFIGKVKYNPLLDEKKQIAKDLEYTDEMIARLDEIRDAAYSLILTLAQKSEEELPCYNEIINSTLYEVSTLLTYKFGMQIYYPKIEHSADGTKRYELDFRVY